MLHRKYLHKYRLSGNLNGFFGLISTYNLSKLPNLNRTFVFSVHIHILEFHNLKTKYACVKVCTYTCTCTSKLHVYQFSGSLVAI